MFIAQPLPCFHVLCDVCRHHVPDCCLQSLTALDACDACLGARSNVPCSAACALNFAQGELERALAANIETIGRQLLRMRRAEARCRKLDVEIRAYVGAEVAA